MSDEPERHYPVIVTVEMVHVVWVHGADQEDAFQRARYNTYELLNDQETLAESGMSLRKPGDDFHHWDWDTIRDGDFYGPYQGMKHDGAIEAWECHNRVEKRRTEVAACVVAGHPNVEVGKWNTGTYCPTCGWLERAA